MRTFGVLVWLRMNEVLRKPSTAIVFFLMPPLMLGITGLVFRNGHPFEKRRIAVVGKRCLTLEGPDAMLQEVPSVEAGKALLATHVVNAVVECRNVWVEPRDQRFGRSLAGGGGDIILVESDGFGYARYIFAGLLAYVLILSGLFGMGYTLVKYRERRFLKKLATTPLSPFVFVSAQIAARSILVAMQLGLLMIAASFMGITVSLPVAMLGLWMSMAIGFAIAAFATNAEILGDLINAAGIPLIFLSEVFFPLDVLPPWVATMAGWFPSTLLTRALRGGEVTGLLVWTGVCTVIALATFRWER